MHFMVLPMVAKVHEGKQIKMLITFLIFFTIHIFCNSMANKRFTMISTMQTIPRLLDS